MKDKLIGKEFKTTIVVTDWDEDRREYTFNFKGVDYDFSLDEEEMENILYPEKLKEKLLAEKERIENELKELEKM